MSLEVWKKKLAQEGYGELLVHTDPPNFLYSVHSHPVDTAYVVIKGKMVVWFGGKEQIVGEGERVDAPKHVDHSARIAPEGCTFLIGVRM